MRKSDLSPLARVGVIGVLTALAALGTLLIRVPIPATNGYFNIGDTFVMLAGLWLGPWAGLVVGGVGPTIADAIGFAPYIPATMVTKGLEGFLVGLVAGQGPRPARKIAAVVLGALVIVIGYFVFQAYIYPALATTMPVFAITTPEAALVELLPNSLQGGISAVAALALWRVLGSSASDEAAVNSGAAGQTGT